MRLFSSRVLIVLLGFGISETHFFFWENLFYKTEQIGVRSLDSTQNISVLPEWPRATLPFQALCRALFSESISV